MNDTDHLGRTPVLTSTRHRIVAYDRSTDRVAFEADVPALLAPVVFGIAGVAREDPTGAFSYSLDTQQVSAFASLLHFKATTDRLEYFLEPVGE
ncbi:MAG TPA: hypothetical protein VMU81_03040 [Acetobacteraceae bacterium]|jgi:hypothetical protein|nr:hypothetical protein [Acetobacteraceae bacterium]